MYWVKISCILCVFGCFKDFRPSESFITDYLTGPWKNLTETQVNQEIYPVGTYAYFATLVIAFLITDLVRYKPIIILCGLSGAICFLLIINEHTILKLQIAEFFYGLFLSSEVAYYTYIYAKVDKKHYQEVTSHTKAASLFGRCMAGVVAQLTTSFDLLDYHQLNYLTLSAFILATIWALFLPSVGQSIYFHRPDDKYENPGSQPANGAATPTDYNSDSVLNSPERSGQSIAQDSEPLLMYKIKRAYVQLWKDFLHAFSNSHVVKWSAWWAFSTCGYLQVTNYTQLLWQTAVAPGDTIYNGLVDFLYAIIGATTVFCIGKVPINWSLIGDVSVAFFSLLEGALLLVCFYSYNIILLYGMYIVFGVVYHTMVTVASFEVAKHISEDSYGLIFGINIFFALLLQSLLTLVVLNGGLDLDIRSQFMVYVGYFTVIALIYLVLGIFHIIRQRKTEPEFKIWLKNDSKKPAEKDENTVRTTKSQDLS